jgi:hypothetical protein
LHSGNMVVTAPLFPNRYLALEIAECSFYLATFRHGIRFSHPILLPTSPSMLLN